MKTLLILMFLLEVSRIVHGETAAKLYDCERSDQACPDKGTCDENTKQCTNCESKFGYACHLDFADNSDSTACSTTCKNGGVCLVDTTKCRCDPAFSGDDCANPTISLDCGTDPPDDNSEMKLDITNLIGVGAANEANAQIMVLGADATDNAGDTVCFGADKAISLSVKNKYTAATDMSTNCQAATTTTKDSATLYTREFIIRFERGVTTPATDFIVKATCGPEGGTVTVKADSFQTKPDTAATALKTRSMSNTVAGATVTAALTDDTGTPLESTTLYSLESVITVTLTLTSNADFSSIRVEKFDIDNGATPPTAFTLIENGCPTPNKQIVVKEGPTVDSAKKDEIKITTGPALIDGSKVNVYTFVIKVCLNGDETSCKIREDCTVQRRRRRDAGNNELATLGVGFNVRDEMKQSITELRNDMKNEKECVLTTEITASLVAMAVAILLLLVLVIILSVRAILAHRRDVTVYEHHQMETASTTSLPKMVNGGY